MPEFLTPALERLRGRAEELARELVAIQSDVQADPTERIKRTIAASKHTGIFTMTQLGAGDPAGELAADEALALVVVRDTLAQHNVGHLPGVYGPRAGVLANVGEPLRSTHLVPLLNGEKRSGFAFTEPAGMPKPTWAAIDGDELVVNGQKSYVTGGADADFLLAVVEVEGRGPSMVVIDTAAPGVRLVRRFGTLDGSHHAAFALENVRVPLAHVVGEAGRGLSRAIDQVTDVRMAIAAGCVGTAGWLLDYLADHLRAPRRSGSSPAESERVRLRYGDMRVKAYAARSTLYRTARLQDRGENVVNEVIACKVFATETVGELADTAVQLVGGEALVEGHPVEEVLRRVRSTRLAEGETDTLRVNVSRGFFDLGKGRL